MNALIMKGASCLSCRIKILFPLL